MTDSTQPKLAVTIDHKPNTPTGLKMSPCYKACASPAVVSSKYPTMRATASDPDGGNLKVVQIRVWTPSDNPDDPYYPWKLASYTYNTMTNIKSGSSVQWTSPSPRNLSSQYHWDARACDAYLCSDWTASANLFYFTVDVDDPTLPEVTSTDYPEEVGGVPQWAGGVGVDGVFHFTTESGDATEFRWSIDSESYGNVASASGGSAEVTFTPKTDLTHVLYVQALDSAGNRSDPRKYVFAVKPAPGNAGYWSMNDGSGTTAKDTSDGKHDATLHGDTAWVGEHIGGAVSLDGDGDYLDTAVSTIDTTKSFTVAAWVYLDDNSRYHTVLAQDGAQSSAFYLQYRSAPDGDCWAFGMRDADSADGVTTVALSADKAWLQEWTFVVGIYDAEHQMLRLYVNGVAQPSQPSFSSPIAAANPLNIGRGLHGGQDGWYWQGMLDEVSIYQRVASNDEITGWFNKGLNGTSSS
jgi:hypothetical protein